MGKHVIEIKKAVFVEYSSQDEGVSLSATPGSNHNSNPAQSGARSDSKEAVEVACGNDSSRQDSLDDDEDSNDRKYVSSCNDQNAINDYNR
jgi:hypothetical protein